MSDENKESQNWARYLNALHAVQSAIAYEISVFPEEAGVSPKHLRVGINSAMINNDAILSLLVDKGITTEEEFKAYLADAAEREVKRYEKRYPGRKFL